MNLNTVYSNVSISNIVRYILKLFISVININHQIIYDGLYMYKVNMNVKANNFLKVVK